MDTQVSTQLQMLFRWIHVVVGVLWIGLLYFFNWVNGPFAKTLDGDAKRKVVPELMPRGLFWFRWAALYTWVTGILLLGLVYYMAPKVLLGPDGGSVGTPLLQAWGTILVFAALYDVLWKRLFSSREETGVVVSLVGAIVVIWYFSLFLDPRAMNIHVGAFFGTMMAMNVWMRIWPAQRQIIRAVKEGSAPDPELVAIAGRRSKHNTYMSVPLLFMMVSNHYPVDWLLLVAIVIVGWAATWAVYRKAAKVPGF